MSGELVFIGLGLHDQFGLTFRGQAEAKSCNLLFAEFYTNPMPSLDLRYLNGLVGKQVTVLSRSQVEDQAEEVILSKAAANKVGFLVPGDPMVATTHVDLRLRAHRAGIKTRIIHGASVMSAPAGVAGLQSYKFGRTVTIPAGQGALPESVYIAIKSNLASGLHTLILLEVDVENMRRITIPEALSRILEASKTMSDNTITPETLTVGLARLGAPDMKFRGGTLSELMGTDFGEPPYSIIIPGQLHFMEAEALELLCGARKELVAGRT